MNSMELSILKEAARSNPFAVVARVQIDDSSDDRLVSAIETAFSSPGLQVGLGRPAGQRLVLITDSNRWEREGLVVSFLTLAAELDIQRLLMAQLRPSAWNFSDVWRSMNESTDVLIDPRNEVHLAELEVQTQSFVPIDRPAESAASQIAR